MWTFADFLFAAAKFLDRSERTEANGPKGMEVAHKVARGLQLIAADNLVKLKQIASMEIPNCSVNQFSNLGQTSQIARAVFFVVLRKEGNFEIRPHFKFDRT